MQSVPMYKNAAESKSKVFSPVILFHDHDLVHKRIDYDDPHYCRFIQQKKREVADMLHENGRMWSELRECTLRESPRAGLDYYHGDMRMPLPSLSPSNSSCTASPSPALTYSGLPSPPLSMAPPSPPESVTAVATANGKTGKRRRGNLPKAVTLVLREWLVQHKKHPYPTEEEKIALARETKLTMNQISNWFINARRRILQPLLNGKQDGSNGSHKAELDIYPYEASEHSDGSNSDDYMHKATKRSASKAGIVSIPPKSAKKPYRRPRAPVVAAC